MIVFLSCVACLEGAFADDALGQGPLPEAHCWDDGAYPRKDLTSGDDVDPVTATCPNMVDGQNHVSPLFRRQENCGWCAHFARLHTMEIQASIAFPDESPITLSLQHLVDCLDFKCVVGPQVGQCVGERPSFPTWRCDPDGWNLNVRCDFYGVHGLVKETVEPDPHSANDILIGRTCGNCNRYHNATNPIYYYRAENAIGSFHPKGF